MAQVQVDAPAAQSLAAAGERADIVNGHDHRARTVQHRPLDPRRMEDLGSTWTVGLENLIALAGRVTQRLQEAARVLRGAVSAPAGSAVERDLHKSR
jgi:hypothetical protein